MSALGELLDAADADATLAWALVHALDGDADAAVRRAWERETHARVMLRALGWLPDATRFVAYRARGAATKRGCVCGPLFGEWAPCPVCCDAIRAAVTGPTWEALHAR